PFRRRQHDPTDITLSFGDDVDEGLAIKAQRHRPSQFGLIKGPCTRVDDHRAVDVCCRYLADRLRRLALEILQGGDRHPIGRGHVELPGEERQIARRYLFDDRILDTVEIRSPRFPVIRVPGYLDRLVRLELDEFEWTRADRMTAHVARRHMAGGDRR